MNEWMNENEWMHKNKTEGMNNEWRDEWMEEQQNSNIHVSYWK